jgi:hypothetical protein
MSHHDLKIWPEYMQPKLDGLKPWEHRLNINRDFRAGDTVTFQEFDLQAGAATGRTLGPVWITFALEIDGTHTIFTHTMPDQTAELEASLLAEQRISEGLRRRVEELSADLRRAQLEGIAS